jgi:hypothetical protein
MKGIKNMNNNKNNEKRRVIPIILIIIAIVAMLPVIISLFFSFLPVILLVLFGFLIFLLIRFIRKSKKTTEVILPQEDQPQPNPFQQSDNEFTIIQKAFGLLQRRITEQVTLEYPGARWVWSAPNAIERFKNNELLIVCFNGAGGFNKAQVITHNMLFKGMKYVTLETLTIASPISKNEPVENELTDDDTDDVDEIDESIDSDDVSIPDNTPVNYGLIAFDWVYANMEDINAKYNEAIAQNQAEMLIPADTLPHPDSWKDVCEELKRNGFSVADFCDGGIKVNITD